jgi:hypothetical protein
MAGAAAAWLYVSGLCYCSKHLTDGRIPKAIVARLTDQRKVLDLAERLVTVGLWTDEGPSFQVHDYLEHQRSKKTIESERSSAKVRANKRRGSPEVREPELEEELEEELELPPNPHASHGGTESLNPRANGTNPRAVAASARREALRAETVACPECGSASWNCTRCANRIRKLEAAS